MNKLYGYKMEDLISLANFYNENQNAKLNEFFENFSAFSGKAKGTVRNLYYALARLSKENESFCRKFLKGKQINVNQITEFDFKSQRDLVQNVLQLKLKGYSVRSAVLTLANNDTKLALRFQNKYRNVCKNNPALVEQILKELNYDGEGLGCQRQTAKKSESVKENKSDAQLPDTLMLKLKKEINGLVDRISENVRKENVYLKKRISFLEIENKRLIGILYGNERKIEVKSYFTEKDRRLLN